MPFRIKDVLVVDATIIIGLLILLSFQSISSAFIETEASDFNKKWRDAMLDYDVNWELQRNCKLLNDDRTEYENWFVNEHTSYNDDGSISLRIYDHLPKEVENKIKKNCSELAPEGTILLQRLIEIEYDGYHINYLQQYDDDYVYTYANGNEWSSDRYSEESEYFSKIVTGPYYVNIINVMMIFPFIASAIIASWNVGRKNEETNVASKAAVTGMGIGFVGMTVGFAAILLAFHEVYEPFL